MTYTVAYTPTYKRKNKKNATRSTTSTSTSTLSRSKKSSAKALRTKEIKIAVRGALERLEWQAQALRKDIPRAELIAVLNLSSIAPVADPSGDNVLQELIAKGIIQRPEVRHKVQYFDLSDTLEALKAWTN